MIKTYVGGVATELANCDSKMLIATDDDEGTSRVEIALHGQGWIGISEELVTDLCRLLATKARVNGHQECQKRLDQLARDVLAKPGEVVLSLSRQELDQVIFACEGLMVLTETLDRIFGLRTQVTEQEAQLVQTYVELVSELPPVVDRLREVRS